MARPRVTPVAIVAALLALVMAVVYVSIMRQESDRPSAWFLAALIVGAAAACYGAVLTAAHRVAALVLAGVVLGAAGVLAILSVGFPILVAALLCLLAAARAAAQAPRRPSRHS